MKTNRLRTVVFLLFIIIVSGLLFFKQANIGLPLSRHPNLKVAFLGDQGLNDDAKAVLRLIKSEGAEAAFHQGDFDYADNPIGWDNQISNILGADYPYFSTIGNHDEKEWPTYQKKIVERMAKLKDVVCTGDIGVKSSCIYKGLAYISVAQGIESFKGDYTPYLKESLGKTSGLWQICSWHKNQARMQLGYKQNETGWSVYETCKDAGAIIATGHEHSYSRSYVMDDITNQHIVEVSDTLEIAPGKTFVFVSGIGGKDIRPQELHGDWWGGIYSSTQNANPGALFCTFNVGGNPRKASCYFKDIKGNVPDRFEIVRK